MKLEKYPVTTNRQEYRVVIKEETDSFDFLVLKAQVFVLKQSKYFKKDRWKKVNEYHSKYNNGIPVYLGRYTELARVAVKDYEDWLTAQEVEDSMRETGIQIWENWDGVVR